MGMVNQCTYTHLQIFANIPYIIANIKAKFCELLLIAPNIHKCVFEKKNNIKIFMNIYLNFDKMSSLNDAVLNRKIVFQFLTRQRRNYNNPDLHN